MACMWRVCVRVWRLLEWVNVACLRVYFCKKNLHTDLIWSGLSVALLWSEMIGKALASLRGDEQQARIFTSRASTLYVVGRGDELIRYTSSGWVWVQLELHYGQWVKRRFWSNHNRKAERSPGRRLDRFNAQKGPRSAHETPLVSLFWKRKCRPVRCRQRLFFGRIVQTFTGTRRWKVSVHLAVWSTLRANLTKVLRVFIVK